MANPRQVVVHDGIGFRALTFKADGSTIVYSATTKFGGSMAGLAVGLVSGTADTVELVADGQAVLGRLDHIEGDGFCTVQIEGQAYLPAGDSQTLTRGAKIVGALGTSSAKGYIRNAAVPGGAYAQATATDSSRGRHTVLDVADTDGISVMLGD